MIHDCDFDPDLHLYRKKGETIIAPSVTQCLASVGMYANLDNARKGVVERKSQIGTEVDRLVAMIEREQMYREPVCSVSEKDPNEAEWGYFDKEDNAQFDIDSRVLPYLESYMRMKEALGWKTSHVKYGPLISDNIYGMLCGFEIDQVGALKGEETIADVKCTAEDEPHHGVQLAGYDLCVGGGMSQPRRKRVTFRLQPDGRMAKIQEYKEESDYRIFQSALAITHWKINKKMLDLRKRP